MLFQSASATERRTLPPSVAVSTVAFALRPPADAVLGADADRDDRGITLWIPLVRRTREPFLGRWALPGGPTEWDETLTDTALRTLHDAVLRNPGYLEQLYSFGGVERSADAQRLVTIAYWALYGERDTAKAPNSEPPRREERWASAPRRWDDPDPVRLPDPLPAEGSAGDPVRDRNVAWFSADAPPALAFDHSEIVAYALARLRLKTEYAAVAHRFLGPTFTLGQLRAVTEAVSGREIDPANFRRQALARGRLIDTGETETGTPHRPARLYRFREETDPGIPRPSDHTPRRSRP